MLLGAGRHVRATTNLTRVYAMPSPGRYHVAFDGWLHDVTTGTLSVAHQTPHPLNCAPVTVEIAAVP